VPRILRRGDYGHAVEVTDRAEHFSSRVKQRNAVVALKTLPLGMTRNAPVQRGLLHAEKLAGSAYVEAIGFRDRLIGALGNILIFLVNQADVAKHIAVESEDSREAIRHAVVDLASKAHRQLRSSDRERLRLDFGR
jgi:hypothetical protein